MAKPTDKQIKACRKLGMTDEEIAEMYACDEEVGKGAKMPWDLSDEDHKKAMKYANADEHAKPKTPVKKERKENATKAAVISEIAEFLTGNCELQAENVTITNKERQISFQIGAECFELTLVQKRKPKN